MKLSKLLCTCVLFGLTVLGVSITAYAESRGVVTGDNVNLRTEANTNSSIATVLSKGTTITVTEKIDDWFKLETANYGTAYISDKYFEVNYVEATVLGEEVNVRANPSTDADILGIVYSGEEMIILSVDGKWCKMQYGTDTAYIHRDLVENDMLKYLGVKFTEAPQPAYVPDTNLTLSQKIISFARNYIGTPYRWGGTDLNSGVDCSGFVYSVFKNFGINIQRTSKLQATEGVYIPREQLQMGDLVFFDCSGVNDGNIGHVGIYMEDGYYIHSSSGKIYSVTINNLNEDYSNRTYVTARRILQ